MEISAENQHSDRAAIREKLEETRQAYHRLAQAIPADGWEAPSSNPAWNVRQLMWHIIYALKMLPSDLTMLRRVRRQIPMPPGWIFHPVNRLVTRWGARGLTPEKAVRQYDQALDKVIALLDDLQEEELLLYLNYPDWDPALSGRVTIERLFMYPWTHFQEHYEQIQAAVRLEPVDTAETSPS